jgi:hypothetical protein
MKRMLNVSDEETTDTPSILANENVFNMTAASIIANCESALLPTQSRFEVDSIVAPTEGADAYITSCTLVFHDGRRRLLDPRERYALRLSDYTTDHIILLKLVCGLPVVFTTNTKTWARFRDRWQKWQQQRTEWRREKCRASLGTVDRLQERVNQLEEEMASYREFMQLQLIQTAHTLRRAARSLHENYKPSRSAASTFGGSISVSATGLDEEQDEEEDEEEDAPVDTSPPSSPLPQSPTFLGDAYTISSDVIIRKNKKNVPF